MHHIWKAIDRLDRLAHRRSRGQGLAEYALILALIAIVAIVALLFMGGQVSNILSNIGNSV
ncbi:MAG: Flp/Fap pilin component [Chloroflexota bacterium]|nr:Flp/Fap pilin component [Chloroflexota bacterium]